MIYIGSLLLTVVLTVLLTLFFQALFRGNPVGLIDYWVRKHLKSKRLEGKNLTFSNRYRLTQEQDFEYFCDEMGLNLKPGNLPFNVRLQKISNITVETPTKKGEYLYVMKFNNKSVNGELELSFLNNRIFDNEKRVNELDADMKITKWKYKDIPYILIDLISLQASIHTIFTEKYPTGIKVGDVTLNIETNRTTPAMQYFSKLKTNLIVGTSEALKVSLGKRNISLSGPISGEMVKEINDIIIWYV